jgi:hypothetical protein
MTRKVKTQTLTIKCVLGLGSDWVCSTFVFTVLADQRLVDALSFDRFKAGV